MSETLKRFLGVAMPAPAPQRELVVVPPAPPMLAELAAIEAQEEAGARAAAASARRQTAIASVALVQMQARFAAQARALAALEAQMGAARALLPAAAKAPRAPRPQGAGGPSPRSGGDWRTSVPYQFWLAYKRAYKADGATQKELSALCKARGIDQADRGAATLARAHEALPAARP